jgi:copper(I)-binding protein
MAARDSAGSAGRRRLYEVTNTGKVPDRLVGGTLDHARRFEVHETTMTDNVMRMRPLSAGLEIKPGETIELKPGSYHIMGVDLDGGYRQGQTAWGIRPTCAQATVRLGS